LGICFLGQKIEVTSMTVWHKLHDWFQ